MEIRADNGKFKELVKVIRKREQVLELLVQKIIQEDTHVYHFQRTDDEADNLTNSKGGESGKTNPKGGSSNLTFHFCQSTDLVRKNPDVDSESNLGEPPKKKAKKKRKIQYMAKVQRVGLAGV
eukprot:3566783-Ditylum_brightwellii.AAC.1